MQDYNVLLSISRLTVVSRVAKDTIIYVHTSIKNATTVRIYTIAMELVSTPTEIQCYLTNIP